MTEYSISTWLLRDCSLGQTIDFLSASGFRRIELSGTGSALVRAWEEDCLALKRQLAGVGISIDSVHCSMDGRRDFDSPDDDARKSCLQENVEYLKRMQDCGIRDYVLHAGGEFEFSLERQRKARESLFFLADQASGMGLRINLENTRKKPGPEATLAILLELLDGAGPEVGLCHDVGHSALAGLDPVAETLIGLRSGRLYSLHLHDVDAQGIDHGLPGHGKLDLDSLIRELNRAGFAGVRTLELKPAVNDPESRLARAEEAVAGWTKL